MHYLIEPGPLLSRSSAAPTLKIPLSQTGFAPRMQQTSPKMPWTTGCGTSRGSWNNGHARRRRVAAPSTLSQLCKRSAASSSMELSVSLVFYISHLHLTKATYNRNGFSITQGTYELPQLRFKGCRAVPDKAHWVDLSRVQEPIRYPRHWWCSHTIGGTPVWEVLLGKDD